MTEGARCVIPARLRGPSVWLAVCALTLTGFTDAGAGMMIARRIPNLVPANLGLAPELLPDEFAPQVILPAEVFGASSGPIASAAPGQDNPFASVDACLEREMRDKSIRGASLAIAVDRALAHTMAFGVRRAGSPEPVDTRTIFRINSTTKMMAAASVMQQVEAGRLDLHAPITQYVPELAFKAPWRADSVTLHALLANAGGLPDPYLDYTRVPREYVMPDWDVDLTTWMRGLVNMHLYATPGSFWNYSSPNFSLAALPVERMTGLTFEDYVRQRLWLPAGMTVTTFDPDEVLASGNYATGHVGGQVSHAPGDYQRRYAAPAGGAYSTPTELITWTLQLMNDGGAILSPESVERMTTPYYEAEAVPWSPRSAYGYGIFIDTYRSTDDPSHLVRVLRHPGNGRGYSTELVWVPETGFALALLINDYNSMKGTVDCALRQIAGLEPNPMSGASPPSRWDQYTGTYDVTDVYGAHWTGQVRREGSQMRISYTDWALAPTIARTLPSGSDMQHYFFDTFAYDYAGNQVVTFEPGGDDSGHAGWMHNRYFVGRRVGMLPESLTMTGAECASLDFTPGISTSALEVRAHGLSRVGQWIAQPARQDDPDDPSTSSFKVDLDVSGHLGYLTAWLFEEPDDNLEMYLMQDLDQDGVFAWPEELVARLTSSAAEGMFVPERYQSGDYQLWVHGQSVLGASSVFNLEIVAVSGTELITRDVPKHLTVGEPSRLAVCAQPGLDDDGDRVGVVEVDFGAPASVVRVPVYWHPATTPEVTGTTIFLPGLSTE